MNFKTLLGIVAVGSAMIGCDVIDKTEDSINTVEAIDAMRDYTTATAHFQAVAKVSDAAVTDAEEDSQPSQLKTGYPTITVEPADFTSFPKNIVIDFGPDGVEGKDYRIRKGKLNIVLKNGWYREVGSFYSSTFEDFYQDGYKIEGTHTVVNNGTDSENNITFNVKVENGKVTDGMGNVITYTQNNTRTWVEGENTPLNVWDDVYELSGIQSGKSAKGVDYTLTTRTDYPLVIDLSCRYIKGGILDVDIQDTPEMSIDYSKGKTEESESDCSPGAQLTIGNMVHDI